MIKRTGPKRNLYFLVHGTEIFLVSFYLRYICAWFVFIHPLFATSIEIYTQVLWIVSSPIVGSDEISNKVSCISLNNNKTTTIQVYGGVNAIGKDAKIIITQGGYFYIFRVLVYLSRAISNPFEIAYTIFPWWYFLLFSNLALFMQVYNSVLKELLYK